MVKKAKFLVMDKGKLCWKVGKRGNNRARQQVKQPVSEGESDIQTEAIYKIRKGNMRKINIWVDSPEAID